MRTAKDFEFRLFKTMYDGTKEMVYNNPVDLFAIAEDEEDLPIMQWTGLLDKNGKKIFEGDIMLINNNIGTFERKADIFWDKIMGSWAYNEYAPNRPKLYCDGVPVGEVIGNIYENPELIKDTK